MTELGAVVKFAGWFLPFFNGLVFAIGVPGNLFVLRVFSDKQYHRPILTLVAGLAVSDLLVCLCRMVILYLSLAGNSNIQDGVAVLNCRISEASLYFSIYIAVFPLTAVAFDRYATFFKPMRFRVTVRKTRLLLALCFAGALMLSCALPLFGEYDTVEDSRLCTITSPQWLTGLRFYSLLVLTVVALVTIASLYVAISRAIRRRVRVKNDGRSNQSCLSLISGATRVSLNVTQIPSLGGPPPALPPRAFACHSDVATTSHDSPGCSSEPTDENPKSEIRQGKSHEAKGEHAGRKQVRFGDLRASARSRGSPVGRVRKYSHPPPSKTVDSRMARLMFARILVFSLAWVPLVVLMVLEHFSFTAVGVWLDVCLHLVLVNSALSVVIFAVASRQFRTDFRELFRAIRCFWEPRFERNRPIHLHHPYWIR